jgi:two-component system LytT family response regulator
MIRVVIVDDEAPARGKLRAWCAREQDLEIVGEYADGLAAARGIAADAADVAFLDVQMPGLSGLEVAAQFETDSAPLIVFVTAHDAHATAAFDLDAVDYLLKPYDEARFLRALARARERLAEPGYRARGVHVARAQPGLAARLLVPAGDGLRLIDAGSIHSLEADDNYVEVRTAEARYLLRRTLQDLLQQLGPGRFVRIHKSTAVNLAEIDSLAPLFKGDYEIRLRSGRLLRLSRRYTAELFALTGR